MFKVIECRRGMPIAYSTVLMGSYTSTRGPSGPRASTKSQVYFVINSVREWTDPHYMMGTSRMPGLLSKWFH